VLNVSAAALLTAMTLGACKSEDPAKPATVTEAPAAAAPDKNKQATDTEAKVAAKPQAAPQPAAAEAQGAAIGEQAPDFSLKDLNGNEVKLADFKGKTVVLEWFNPECPFVKLSHTKGSLQGLAKKQEGVVWLAINSGAEGKQGFGVDKNRGGAETFGLAHPILMDADGTFGRAYGATNTPHLYIIDPSGKLASAGAIDNSPDGEGASPSDGILVNYVAQALEELAAGKPVSVPKTKAYGCGVKYSG
jgi:cytochrome oxidase Cu insertion factor (SCO1/SenC/PrrC family)